MYKIRSADNQEQGPFTAHVVRQWITAGRADSRTQLQKIGEPEWKPLGAFAEFRDLLPRNPAAPGHAPAKGEDVDAPAEAPRLCGLAVGSLALGIVGMLGVTAIAGLALGFRALTRIADSDGQLKGAAVAIVGMVLSAAMLVTTVPLAAGLYLPYMTRKRQAEYLARCEANMRQVVAALQSRLVEHGGVYPSAQTWKDDLIQSRTSEFRRFLECPSRSGLHAGYAFNKYLSGLHMTNVNPGTILIFESELKGNAAGANAELASSRHGHKLVFGFADGRVELVPAWQLSQMRWLPNAEIEARVAAELEAQAAAESAQEKAAVEGEAPLAEPEP